MFTTSEHEFGADVAVTKINPDTVYQFLDTFLDAMRGCGFNYIDRLEAYSNDKSWSTEV
jgi:hypothetical protein